MRRWLAVASGAMVCALPAAAAADTPLGDPSSNRDLSSATFQACAGDANGASCLASASADIDAARALEGVGPISLPTNWASLSIPIQLLVIADLERVDRGLIPVTGLSTTLNGCAQQGADAGTDPPFPGNPGCAGPFPGSFGTGNWAGGYASPLEADFGWMYDDGLGSPNIDCTQADPSGCWGHRHSVLLTEYPPAPAPPLSSVVMGAAVSNSSPQPNPSMAEEFITNDTTDTADVTPAWTSITSALPVGVSTSSLTVLGGSSKTIQIWASGENMNVTTAISSGWSVAPAGCNLVAGQSCTLTVSAATGAGTGTLTLTGPNGNQTVALTSQTATSLALRASPHTIVFGKKITLTGKLTTAAGAGVSGQSVTLTTRPARGRSTTVTGHTSADGSVTFKVTPKFNTSYSLSFAGTPALTASGSPAVTVKVAPLVRVLIVAHKHRIAGKVSPSLPGKRVKLQRRQGRRWKTVATAKLGPLGAFSFPLQRGAARYRIATPATVTNAAATYATFATVA